jgi:hypothetical protein
MNGNSKKDVGSRNLRIFLLINHFNFGMLIFPMNACQCKKVLN